MRYAQRRPAVAGAGTLCLLLALAVPGVAAAQTTWTYTPPPADVDESIDTTANPLTIDVTADTVTNTGVISGTGSVTKIGPGAYNTTSTNPFSGGLSVENGQFGVFTPGTLSSTAPIVVGEAAGSDGWLRLVGADASVSTDQIVRVGFNGEGLLTVVDGAEFINNGVGDNDGGMLIAGNAAERAELAVGGTDSLVQLNGFITVGEAGVGLLTITSGGRVTALDASVGLTASSDGVVFLDGGNTLLQTARDLNVGVRGPASMLIGNGARVINNFASVGGVAGIGNDTGTGTVTVTGAGSSWTTSDFFYVGRESTGILDILDGGAVEFALGDVGSAAAAIGTLSVDGVGSVFRATDSSVYLGFEGTATANLSNGGALRQDAGIGELVLAVEPGSVAELNVGTDPDEADPPAPPGIVDVSGVGFGTGTGEINFNHSGSDYFFTRDGTAAGAAVPIIGSGAVNVVAGQTSLLGELAYAGPTTLSGGVLRIDGSAANSDLVFSGGVLMPAGAPARLGLASLDWTGGTVSMRLGAETAASDQIELGGALQGGTGLLFDFVDNGWVDGQTYDVMTFGSTTLDAASFDVVPSNLYSGDFEVVGSTLQFTLSLHPDIFEDRFESN